MATKFTKGKTTRKLGAPRPSTSEGGACPSGDEIAAAITAALHPQHKQAKPQQEGEATPAPATPTAAKPKAAASAKKATTTPTPQFPAIEMDEGSSLLLTNILYAKALGQCPVVAEHVALTHDELGTFLLRMVRYKDGFLIGVIDQDNATYSECEFYDLEFTANGAWEEWRKAIAL